MDSSINKQHLDCSGVTLVLTAALLPTYLVYRPPIAALLTYMCKFRTGLQAADVASNVGSGTTVESAQKGCTTSCFID